MTPSVRVYHNKTYCWEGQWIKRLIVPAISNFSYDMPKEEQVTAAVKSKLAYPQASFSVFRFFSLAKFLTFWEEIFVLPRPVNILESSHKTEPRCVGLPFENPQTIRRAEEREPLTRPAQHVWDALQWCVNEYIVIFASFRPGSGYNRATKKKLET